MIPQLIIILLGILGLQMNITKHGKRKKDQKYNWWIYIISTLIYWTVLHYGGFWEALN